MSYTIANYGVLDPSVAVPGKNAICLTSILMYDWEDEWHWNESHEKYDSFKYNIGWRLVERAEEDYLPGLVDRAALGLPDNRSTSGSICVQLA